MPVKIIDSISSSIPSCVKDKLVRRPIVPLKPTSDWEIPCASNINSVVSSSSLLNPIFAKFKMIRKMNILSIFQ